MALSRRAFLSILGSATAALALPMPAFDTLVYEPELVKLAPRILLPLVGLRQMTDVVLNRFVETLDQKSRRAARVADYVSGGAKVGHTICVREPIQSRFLTNTHDTLFHPYIKSTPVTLAHQKHVLFALQPGREAKYEQLAICGEVLAHAADHARINAFANMAVDLPGAEAVCLMRDGVAVRGVQFYDIEDDAIRTRFDILGGRW